MSVSIRALKDELGRMGIDFSGCSERRELEELYAQAKPASTSVSASQDDAASSGSTPAADATPPERLSEAELEAELSKISNLLDTLPAGLQLLDKKWTEARQEKVASQLRSAKEILGRTSAQASALPGWQNRLAEYNGFARDFKRIRDLPRNMSG
jgi:hypothetical protein